VWFASALTKCEPSTNMDLVLGLPPPSVAGQDANPTTPLLFRLESYSGGVSPPKRDATMPKHVNYELSHGPRISAEAPAGQLQDVGGTTLTIVFGVLASTLAIISIIIAYEQLRLARDRQQRTRSSESIELVGPRHSSVLGRHRRRGKLSHALVVVCLIFRKLTAYIYLS